MVIKLRYLLFICTTLDIGNYVNTTEIIGYYWREYPGIIPADAVPGGRDALNQQIYIGQILGTHLIPAKIYSSNPNAYYELGGKEHVVTENIKILCSNSLDRFEWILADNSNISLITNKTLVIGGYEPGCTTYIGRARYQGEVLVGKALTDNDPIFSGLYVTKDGKTKKYTTFEVLSFNYN